MTSSFHDTNRNGSSSKLSRVKYMDVQRPVKVVAGWLQLQMQLGLSCGGWSGGFAQSETDEPGLHDRICTQDRRYPDGDAQIQRFWLGGLGQEE